MQAVGYGTEGGASGVSKVVFLKVFYLLNLSVPLAASEPSMCVGRTWFPLCYSGVKGVDFSWGFSVKRNALCCAF